MIPYFRLKSNKEELVALESVHRSGAWATGSAIESVRQSLAELFKQQQVVLCSSGFSALFISIKALGIKDQKIITPCISTCFAISDAIVASGNTPVFCDVNLEDGNCDIEHVRSLVNDQKINYIISPNYAGNLSAVTFFKNELNLTVIEDACQSFFSSRQAPSAADVRVFSFYPTKGMNGIDGGAILTPLKTIAEKAEHLVYYDDQVSFETDERYNFRFLNMNATLLMANLSRLTKVEEKLKEIKRCYDAVLETKKEVKRLLNTESEFPHRYVVCFQNDLLKEKAQTAFKAAGVSLSLFYEWSCGENDRTQFKNATRLVNNSFCVPYFEDLSEAEMNEVTKTMNDVFA
jgi:perosamine synthetase